MHLAYGPSINVFGRRLLAVGIAIAAAALRAAPRTARGQIFVANYSAWIGEYTTSGATVSTFLVSGLNGPHGIAVSGSDLFVTNYNIVPAVWALGGVSSTNAGLGGRFRFAGARNRRFQVKGTLGNSCPMRRPHLFSFADGRHAGSA
ncbi:MAG: hypothetical protein ABSB74_06475 [Tepidisphaeraceae bacterium]